MALGGLAGAMFDPRSQRPPQLPSPTTGDFMPAHLKHYLINR